MTSPDVLTLLFDIKNEFVNLMSSLPDLGDVQVSYEAPGPKIERESIWLGPTNDWNQDWANIAGGKGQFKETFSQTVYFLSAKPAKTTQEAEQRIAEIFSTAQRAMVDKGNFLDLRNNAYGKQLTNIILTPTQNQPQVSADGRVDQIDAEIKVTGRINL